MKAATTRTRLPALLAGLSLLAALGGCGRQAAPPLPTPLPTTAMIVATATRAPSATPLPAAATATPTAEVVTYVVVAGDTLGAIAKQFGTSVEALIAANELANPDLLAIGDELVIPPPSTPTPTPPPSSTPS